MMQCPVCHDWDVGSGPWETWYRCPNCDVHPDTGLFIQRQKDTIRQLEARVDAMTLPRHKCEPIAVAQLNDVGGRAHWIGKLLEPIPGYEEETHCMHMKTPLKGEVVFGFIMADFHQLAALCEAANGEPINSTWVSIKALDYIRNVDMPGIRDALLKEE